MQQDHSELTRKFENKQKSSYKHAIGAGIVAIIAGIPGFREQLKETFKDKNRWKNFWNYKGSMASESRFVRYTGIASLVAVGIGLIEYFRGETFKEAAFDTLKKGRLVPESEIAALKDSGQWQAKLAAEQEQPSVLLK